MKARTKITALAVFALLAVFSCAPEAELTGVNWKEVNSGYNSGKNSDNAYTIKMNAIIYGFSVTGELATGAGEANEVTITFPDTSDFLKTTIDSKIESGMKQFLSFHHFTKTEDPVTFNPVPGKADTLGSALDYKLVRREANVITVALTKTFAVTDSNVIMKINGTKYTFASGNKLDLVRRGTSGQAGYDDLYFEIPVYTVTGPSEFTGPGNQGWKLTLEQIFELPSAEIEADEYTIATLDLGYFYGNPEAVSDITKAVANQLKGGLKIQEFANGKWTPVSAPVDFLEYEYSPGGIFYTKLTLNDLVPIRVMWEGKAPVVTTAEYFGVKQYIAILGENTSTIDYWGYPNISYPECYQSGKVYGEVGGWYDTYDGRRFNADRYLSGDIFVSRDSFFKNVVFEVVFNPVVFWADPEDEEPTYYWLKSCNLQKFKENFKIAYYSGTSGTVYDFTTRTDVVYVTVKDVEYFNHNPDDDEDIGFNLNAVRITLDPAFESKDRQLYFYISPEIRFADEKTTFGDPANFMHGFFRAYAAYAF
jgi:hypothetical protein